MTKYLALSLAAFLLAANPFPARADQLQCNSQANAQKAVALLPARSILIDFCSMCDAAVEVVIVQSATVVKDCDFEVEITGTVVARSTETFHERAPVEARFRIVEEPYKHRIDLAYAYVETGPNQFSFLGGVLGLKAQVKARTLQLPPDLYKKLGSHITPPAVAAPAAQARKRAIAALGFTGFSAPGLREAAKACDAGDLAGAQQAADRALDDFIARVLPGIRFKGLPLGKGFRELLSSALRERLSAADSPLRGIATGRELMVLERLPTAQLERAVAVLAVWAAATAQAWGETGRVEEAALSLLTSMETLADLYRRAPRAAALAQFYAALYLKELSETGELPENARIVAARLKVYFEDERAAFQGNYAQVLGALLK